MSVITQYLFFPIIEPNSCLDVINEEFEYSKSINILD